MSYSFWANVFIFAASFVSTLLNHSDLVTEIHEEADLKKKAKKKVGLIVVWVVTIVSFVALPLTAWESLSTDKSLREHGKSIKDATNQLALAEARVIELEATTSQRSISPDQRKALVASLQAETNKAPIWVVCTAATTDTRNLSIQIRDILKESGFDAGKTVPRDFGRLFGMCNGGIIESTFDVDLTGDRLALVAWNLKGGVPPEAAILLKAFNAAGVKAHKTGFDALIPGKTVVIVPGKKGF